VMVLVVLVLVLVLVLVQPPATGLQRPWGA
jgi:hypothetical protein